MENHYIEIDGVPAISVSYTHLDVYKRQQLSRDADTE